MIIPEQEEKRKPRKLKLDDRDRKILRELQLDSTRTTRQLSRKLGIPSTTVNNKIKKMERSKCITNYIAIPDYKKLEKGVTALIHMTITSRGNTEEITRKLKEDPRVDDIFVVTGRFDIIAKARFKDTEQLGRFIFDKKTGLRSSVFRGVERTESMIVVDTLKETGLDPNYVCGRCKIPEKK